MADGGDGTDTLQVDITGTSSVLDVTNQANNAGVFAGATVSHIEIFQFEEFDTASSSGIKFTGSDAAETVRGGVAGDTLDGGGGNDVLIGGINNNSPSTRDHLTGGTGGDHFVFASSLDSPSGSQLRYHN